MIPRAARSAVATVFPNGYNPRHATGRLHSERPDEAVPRYGSVSVKQLLSAVAVLAMVGPAFGADEPTFETVLKSEDGGPKKAAEVVIRSEKEWVAFIETCASEDLRKFLKGVKVDFAKETVVAVAIGPNASHLTKTEMKQVGAQKVVRDGDKAVVEYCVVETDVRLAEPRHPFHVIKIAKTADVTFKKSEKTIGG
jgi:hypothetical protein